MGTLDIEMIPTEHSTPAEPAEEEEQREQEQSVTNESETKNPISNLLQTEFIQETLEKSKVKLWRFRLT